MTLKRSYIRRKPRRNRPPVDWPHLQQLVTRRDAERIVRALHERLLPLDAANILRSGQLPCVAWVIEGGPIICYGPWHLEHVKNDYRTGQKAPDDQWHLVSLCAAHDERGMTAGEIWNTKAESRNAMRRYLAEVNV